MSADVKLTDLSSHDSKVGLQVVRRKRMFTRDTYF